MCVCAKGYIQGTVWIERDNTSVYATCGGASPICGRGVAECLQEWTRINPGCSRPKQLSQDSAGEVGKKRDHNQRKKIFRKKEGPTRTGNPL